MYTLPETFHASLSKFYTESEFSHGWSFDTAMGSQTRTLDYNEKSNDKNFFLTVTQKNANVY